MFLFRLGELQLSLSPAQIEKAQEKPALSGMGMCEGEQQPWRGEKGDCGRKGRLEESISTCGENTQPQPWGCKAIGGFDPPQWKSRKVAVKARNMVSLSSRVEIIILQCSDLHLHPAAEGPFPWPETLRCCADRAALPPTQLGQAEWQAGPRDGVHFCVKHCSGEEGASGPTNLKVVLMALELADGMGLDAGM